MTENYTLESRPINTGMITFYDKERKGRDDVPCSCQSIWDYVRGLLVMFVVIKMKKKAKRKVQPLSILHLQK